MSGKSLRLSRKNFRNQITDFTPPPPPARELGIHALLSEKHDYLSLPRGKAWRHLTFFTPAFISIPLAFREQHSFRVAKFPYPEVYPTIARRHDKQRFAPDFNDPQWHVWKFRFIRPPDKIGDDWEVGGQFPLPFGKAWRHLTFFTPYPIPFPFHGFKAKYVSAFPFPETYPAKAWRRDKQRFAPDIITPRNLPFWGRIAHLSRLDDPQQWNSKVYRGKFQLALDATGPIQVVFPTRVLLAKPHPSWFDGRKHRDRLPLLAVFWDTFEIKPRRFTEAVREIEPYRFAHWKLRKFPLPGLQFQVFTREYDKEHDALPHIAGMGKVSHVEPFRFKVNTNAIKGRKTYPLLNLPPHSGLIFRMPVPNSGLELKIDYRRFGKTFYPEPHHGSYKRFRLPLLNIAIGNLDLTTTKNRFARVARFDPWIAGDVLRSRAKYNAETFFNVYRTIAHSLDINTDLMKGGLHRGELNLYRDFQLYSRKAYAETLVPQGMRASHGVRLRIDDKRVIARKKPTPVLPLPFGRVKVANLLFTANLPLVVFKGRSVYVDLSELEIYARTVRHPLYHLADLVHRKSKPPIENVGTPTGRIRRGDLPVPKTDTHITRHRRLILDHLLEERSTPKRLAPFIRSYERVFSQRKSKPELIQLYLESGHRRGAKTAGDLGGGATAKGRFISLIDTLPLGNWKRGKINHGGLVERPVARRGRFVFTDHFYRDHYRTGDYRPLTYLGGLFSDPHYAGTVLGDFGVEPTTLFDDMALDFTSYGDSAVEPTTLEVNDNMFDGER